MKVASENEGIVQKEMIHCSSSGLSRVGLRLFICPPAVRRILTSFQLLPVGGIFYPLLFFLYLS